MMAALKLALGIIFLLLGWIYLFKPNIVLGLNRIARDFLFNDRVILLARKRVSIFFFCLSIIALYMGFTTLSVWVSEQNKYRWAMESNQYLMYMAMQDYCTERYASAIDKYQHVLQSDPGNTEALKRLAYTYDAMGDKKNARAAWKKLLRMNPNDTEIIEKLKRK